MSSQGFGNGRPVLPATAIKVPKKGKDAKPAFYGLNVDGNGDLIVTTGSGNFNVADYQMKIFWVEGAVFSIVDGDLHVTV